MDEIIKAIYDSVNTESVPAREIVIPEHGTWAFVSERKLLCYTGVCMKEERPELMLEMSPYYFTGKHSGDRSVKSKINGFFRLDQGAIILDDFIDEIYNGDEKFKRLPIHVKYPTGAVSYTHLNGKRDLLPLRQCVPHGLEHGGGHSFTRLFSAFHIFLNIPQDSKEHTLSHL